MPRPTLPPTPASSTDINGRDGTKDLEKLQMTFELLPPAMTAGDQAASSQFPLQASETVKSRRRSSAISPHTTRDEYDLPPPPTRSRKIIQMKPKEPAIAPAPGASKNANDVSESTLSDDEPQLPAASGGKRKQAPSATSAAGRKIARKTAHSLIERRRRSKMNEEFATLKDMVPACTGEMHKLAILQATIDYVQYLEDCIAQLKIQSQKNTEAAPPEEEAAMTPRSHGRASEASHDVEMVEPEALSSANSPRGSLLKPSSTSARLRQESQSSRSTSTDQRDLGYTTSTLTSPIFGPQTGQYQSGSNSVLASPALRPQTNVDHEVTAALLTLSQSDRRTAPGYYSGRGMSVKDLLTP